MDAWLRSYTFLYLREMRWDEKKGRAGGWSVEGSWERRKDKTLCPVDDAMLVTEKMIEVCMHALGARAVGLFLPSKQSPVLVSPCHASTVLHSLLPFFFLLSKLLLFVVRRVRFVTGLPAVINAPAYFPRRDAITGRGACLCSYTYISGA